MVVLAVAATSRASRACLLPGLQGAAGGRGIARAS